MNPQAIAQIANFLNVSPNQIKRCEEWVSVIFVVVRGSRPRFISKKATRPVMFKKFCKRSGLEFESENKLIKQHPVISEWLQKANKEGWYSDCVKAVEKLFKAKAKTIQEFNQELEIIRKESLEANQKSQAERNAYFQKIEQQRKERQRINSLLKKAGYSWGQHYVDMFQISSDEFEWVLFDPNGNATTIEQALKDLGVK